MKLVYLASPYTHQNEMVMNLRATLITDITAHLMAEYGDETTFYSPISYGHNLVNSFRGKELPKDWEYWCKHDINMIRKSDAVWVIQMSGWNTSKGILSEIAFCEQHSIPVEYVPLSALGMNLE